MLDAVIGYALINIMFELTVLSFFVPKKPRAWLLGSSGAVKAIHIVMMCFTLWVHWGTLLGTTGAFAAFPASVLAMFLAAQLFGFVRREPTLVTVNTFRNWGDYLDAPTIREFEDAEANGQRPQLTRMLPHYHRRVLGYRASELI